MNKEYYKELIEQIVNVTWTIKVKHEKYKPSKNFRIKRQRDVIMKFVSYTDDEKEINGMIYYSYLLYLGCLYE